MNSYFDNMRNTFTSFYDRIRDNVPAVILVYFGVVFVHFVCSNIYPSMCCPWTIWGFIMSPFMTVTPHCEGLRWVIHYTGEQIRNAWVWLGGYLVWYFGNQITPYINTFRANTSNNVQIISENVETNTDIVNMSNVETNTDTAGDDTGNVEENEQDETETLRRRTRSRYNNN